MTVLEKKLVAEAVFADTDAAHAFLDLAEQAPEGAVYLRGVELAKGALVQIDIAVVEMPDNRELAAARHRLQERLEALSATCFIQAKAR